MLSGNIQYVINFQMTNWSIFENQTLDLVESDDNYSFVKSKLEAPILEFGNWLFTASCLKSILDKNIL